MGGWHDCVFALSQSIFYWNNMCGCIICMKRKQTESVCVWTSVDWRCVCVHACVFWSWSWLYSVVSCCSVLFSGTWTSSLRSACRTNLTVSSVTHLQDLRETHTARCSLLTLAYIYQRSTLIQKFLWKCVWREMIVFHLCLHSSLSLRVFTISIFSGVTVSIAHTDLNANDMHTIVH